MRDMTYLALHINRLLLLDALLRFDIRYILIRIAYYRRGNPFLLTIVNVRPLKLGETPTSLSFALSGFFTVFFGFTSESKSESLITGAEETDFF